MLPYFELTHIPFLNVDSFSFFMFLGIFAGYLWSMRCALSYGYSLKVINEMFCFTIIPAYVGAHLFHIVAYDPYKLIDDPGSIFDLNSGLASFGAILSFLICSAVVLRIQKRSHEWLSWLDIVSQGLVIGLLIGRIGCALIHDHLGKYSSFFLTVQYQHSSRHDLGIYEFIFLAIFLFPAMLYARRRSVRVGLQAGFFCVCYGIFRLLSDSLRTGDARYYELTPGQYSAIVILMLGCGLLWRVFYTDREPQFAGPQVELV